MLTTGIVWVIFLWLEILIYRPTLSLISIAVGSPMIVIGLWLVGWSRLKLKRMGSADPDDQVDNERTLRDY